MENINGWTKRLLLGLDENSWKIHSPNLMCAHRSNNFEIDAFTKHSLDFDTNEEPTIKEYSFNSTKTTEPRKTIEQQRIYEWSVLMFHELQSRKVREKDGFNCINELNTQLKNPKDMNDPYKNDDPLESYIDEIFNNTDRTDDTSNDLIDNNNIIDDETLEDNQADDDDTIRRKIHALSIIDIFDHTNKELTKVNVNKVQMNKKQRLEQSDQFYRDIYNNILNESDEFDADFSDIINGTQDKKPWFQSSYNMLSQLK